MAARPNKKAEADSSEVSGVSGARLLSYIERIERLEEEKRGIADDIKEVKAEAKSFGFDVPTINAIIKLRRLTQEQRDEQEALLDIYRAALGMLFDTPLGEAARRRLSAPPPRHDDPDGAPGHEALDEPEDEPVDPHSAVSADDARAMGTEAALQGIPVTRNPFAAGDKRRAIWDEAWCAALGTDGMDIPEPFRRRKPDTPQPDAGGEQ
ncbi:MAG: DUF2312 domain-containing protein [Rhodospirillales bacterium]|nr:DUF2312 domain-containing protein [Rhodospirillales bacterium]MBN8927429.1 DUF2312 domain-containing protein [Rhodospirillales bacterium]